MKLSSTTVDLVEEAMNGTSWLFHFHSCWWCENEAFGWMSKHFPLLCANEFCAMLVRCCCCADLRRPDVWCQDVWNYSFSLLGDITVRDRCPLRKKAQFDCHQMEPANGAIDVWTSRCAKVKIPRCYPHASCNPDYSWCCQIWQCNVFAETVLFVLVIRTCRRWRIWGIPPSADHPLPLA